MFLLCMYSILHVLLSLPSQRNLVKSKKQSIVNMILVLYEKRKENVFEPFFLIFMKSVKILHSSWTNFNVA